MKKIKVLFITKENLKVFIKRLKSDCDEFIAPKKEHLNDIIFGDTKSDGAELLDYDGNAALSPRAFLLPTSEVILEIKSVKKSDLLPVEDKLNRIFYGVRPCDIKAIGLMREFFLEGICDKPYEEKFKRSVFIAVSCTKRCLDTAFCDEMGSGPAAKSGFDLQLFSRDKGYIVEIGSKKGNQLVTKNKSLFTKPSGQDIKEKDLALKNFLKERKPIDYKKLAGIMKQDKVNSAVWDDIGQRCVVCSGCITVCPTCSCFSIMDRVSGDKGQRIRYSDGCPYAGFTRMAGGTTPFPLHKDHIRRYFEHKLNIDVERYGTPSCVGCSRCIQTCPGNISIRKFIDDAMLNTTSSK